MNGLLLVDKPEGWTSFDVIAKLKGVLHERRLGHSGTLDPLATGLLVVFAGRATRAVEYAEAQTKRYIASLRLGVSTDTQDITGTVLCRNECGISQNELESVLPRFTGQIEQIPPMYSAIKINGQRLYDIARKGNTVDRKPRSIVISSIDVIGKSGEDFVLDVTCSKGTYIRTLCSDIGDSLGCGGCMSSLRRVACGAFGIGDAHTLEEIISAADSGRLSDFMLPVESVFGETQRITVNERLEKRIRCGNIVEYSDCEDGEYLVFSKSGEFLMLGRADNGLLYTVKNFFEVNS